MDGCTRLHAREAILEADRMIRAAIAETGQVRDDVPPGLKALYPDYAGPFLRSLLALDPAALAARAPVPVLVVMGGADMQVSATADGGVFAAALADRSDGSAVVTLAGLSHAFKPAAPGVPSFEGPVAASFLGTLLAWMGARL
ncbi:hypothetical protein [Arenibaculum pallidiluteum]|uniref:hypothetical protein n=1 Tax=Arenibaculum pallidiluteum TaxID=2812559 RepID=UPI001A95C949|nr:hypothetical protein [Arenibaculum pallidiluteum]